MMVASVLMTTALAVVPSAASANTVSASEVASALSATSANSHDLVAEPAQSSTDVDSAAVATSDSVKVDVPKDLSNGVGVTANGQEMSISLPNAGDAGKATRHGYCLAVN
jgi:alkaline phosphatase